MKAESSLAPEPTQPNQASPDSKAGGLDVVEISRMERLLESTAAEDLGKLFSETERREAGDGPGRAASLAGRFAAKEACCKLFPRETALGRIAPADFSVERDTFGAPTIVASPDAQAVLDMHRIEHIRVSISHTATVASAVAWAEARRTNVPWLGRLLYHMLPYRRGLVLDNMRRVFGQALAEEQIHQIALEYYAHYFRFLCEFVRLPFMSQRKREAWIRVENKESPVEAHKKGKGLLILTGHFGNFEVATTAGISQFPQYRGLFHFVRRPLKPAWFNYLVTRRFRRAGFGTIAKRGSLDRILSLLEGGAIIVYVFDQHAHKGDGIPVEFFGHPAGTFKSLAIIAMSTGAQVIPASSWREPDGSHVLRFEEPLATIECHDVGEAIRRNTRAYNAALERLLLRHPEQWIWMHKRWKI